MGPRKKSRPNSEAPGSSGATEPALPPLQTDSRSNNATDAGSRSKDSRPALDRSKRKSTDLLNNNLDKRSSWYGGSWRGKASPVAQVARESISVAKGATSESSAESINQPSSPLMSNTIKMARKSIPVIAEATKVNASGSNTEAGEGKASKVSSGEGEKEATQDMKGISTSASEVTINPPLPPTPTKDTASEDTDLSGSHKASGTWFGWWSRPEGYPSSEAGRAHEASQEQPPAVEASATPLPGSPQENRDRGKNLSYIGASTTTAANVAPQAYIGPETQPQDEDSGQTHQRQTSRSWFGIWSASQNSQDQDKPASTPVQQDMDTSSVVAQAPAPEEISSANEANIGERQGRDSDETQPRSSGWAFWSKDKPSDHAADSDGPQKHLGELAVADTPSQSHPEAAQFNEQQRGQQGKKKSSAPATTPSSIKDKKSEPKTIRTESAFATNAEAPSPSTPGTPEKSGKAEATKIANAAIRPLKTPQARPNLVLPRFNTTYSQAYIPSYLERFGQYITSSLRIVDAPTTPNHVAITPDMPKIRNAVAIGIHGYFPAPLIQKVLGQPTGTSIRFANAAASAIKLWVEQNQPDTPCEIEQVALEGEGFIADRVSTLWKLLLNWLSQLRSADLILVAAHSQGVPVAVMLVAKLINLGCLNPHAKIGICAMAGVNLGPFADFKSKYYGGSAVELFEFGRPDSKVSKDYASQLDIALRHGVRITYVGSLDDQLVSLESSTFSNLTHPYVQRAVFVDGRVHAPDFISQLVAFTLKLRNLGISDHGLIRELSIPLAGSIYGGDGHSRVYDDDEVYQLALQFTLETTDIDPKTTVQPSGAVETTDQRRSFEESRRSQGGVPATTTVANSIRRGSFSAASNAGVAPYIGPYDAPVSGAGSNPYYLPWAMRGILEERTVKETMQDEVQELLRLFDDWMPTTKPLKDVKFRLEAVKSRL